jgi:hypothetical protein
LPYCSLAVKRGACISEISTRTNLALALIIRASEVKPVGNDLKFAFFMIAGHSGENALIKQFVVWRPEAYHADPVFDMDIPLG